MKNEKIYSNSILINSLYYFLALEDNDVVDENCCIRFANSWAPINKNSAWIGKTMTEVKSSLSKCNPPLTHDIMVAKRFLNAGLVDPT